MGSGVVRLLVGLVFGLVLGLVTGLSVGAVVVISTAGMSEGQQTFGMSLSNPHVDCLKSFRFLALKR